MAESNGNENKDKFRTQTLGDLMDAFRVLAAKFGKDIKVGFELNGRVAQVTGAEQWTMYTGPFCGPGQCAPTPVTYINLSSNQWV